MVNQQKHFGISMLFQKEKLELKFLFWPISIIVFRGILLMSYA